MAAARKSNSKPHAERRPRQRETQLAFEALAIEGGLLSPDWLARVAALDAGSQGEADYRIPKGLQLRDEIGRYWRIAQAHWHDFAAGRASATTPAAARALAERFVLSLLRESFGFASLDAIPPAVIAERSYPIGFAALGGRAPVVIAPAASGLDTLAPASGDGGRRRSVFGLAQEYLNAAEGATWGLATDGLALRILRDNASLTRPAWIEADLARIFLEERYADFAALWLLAHETRFGRADQPPADCALEIWREAGREEGTRAREHLRGGVEDALVALGQGFLTHPDNTALRAALQNGSLSITAYFQELLRLVYRLIFLLTVEERGLLHPTSSSEAARLLYAEGYGVRRLSQRSVRRSAHDRFFDLWETTKIVFHGLAAGEPRLALPALAGLFAPAQCPTLDTAKLENRALLLAVFRLSWLRQVSGLARVNWRDMGPEELGSVYESLLELVPQVTQGGRLFAFAAGGETQGNARKTSGSYYTPDSLVQVLLDSALEPVVASTLAASPERPAEALLQLSVVDPACGSGHFLLAAARRLAGHLARLLANGTPSAPEYRHALRQVVGRCLYGVDLNPMAVELCKVSLWMEAVEPGLPLTFLDAHIRHGNALLGTTPNLMAAGIPDAAWSPIEGDDRKVASGLRKRNKRSSQGQRALDTLSTKPAESETAAVARAVAEMDGAPDTDAAALARKAERWEAILDSAAYRHQKLVADTWCAAFVWPKQEGPLQDAAPTNDVWLQIRDRQGHPNPLTVKTTGELAEQYRFFHWQLAFPQVFGRGGFDLVLSNPPWEHVELKEKEWFAERRPEIAGARNGSQRKKMIEELRDSVPSLYAAFAAALREHAGSGHFLGDSGRFPLCGRGRVNLYAVFAEATRSVLAPRGLLGCVLPTGIATDDTTKLFFQDVINTKSIVSLFDFENKDLLFSAIAPVMKFCLFTSGSGMHPNSADARFVFFAHSVRDLQDPERQFTLSSEDIKLLNPNSRTCPIFRSARDMELTKAIYRRQPVLIQDGPSGSEQNPWGVSFKQGLFNLTSDSALFRTKEGLEEGGWRLDRNVFRRGEAAFLPLYEAKLFHQFNHRPRTFDGVPQVDRFKVKAPTRELSLDQLSDPWTEMLPRYWVDRTEVEAAAGSNCRWMLAFRDMTNVMTNSRNAIFAILPFAAVGHSAPIVSLREPALAPFLLAAANSFVFDYTTRQKLGGGHLTFFILKQLPVPRPEHLCDPLLKGFGESLEVWILKRALELTYTAWDLQPFAHDLAYEGPPFRWDPIRRFLLRSELNAAFFHLYGLSRDDTAYILDTFPIVRKHDEATHGEYRTKRVILEIYDAMTEATRTGRTYSTRLDPPPADPRVAHPPDPSRSLPT